MITRQKRPQKAKKQAREARRGGLLDYVRRVESQTFANCVDLCDVHEWRVAFAGQLWPRRFIGKFRGPWSQARLLMEEPFEIVTSAGLPRSGAEQLCVRLAVLPAEETIGRTTIIGGHSGEVLDELVSILCLLTRTRLRVITRTATYVAPHFLRQDVGHPEVRRMDRIIQSRMPDALMGTIGDTQDAAQSDCDLDGEEFSVFLRALAKDSAGESFIAAARAFATALDLQDARPEVAYLLLVSSVESLACIENEAWHPPRAAVLEARRPLLKAIRKLPLTDPQREAILKASLEGDRWVKRKFVRYLQEHVTRTVVCPGLTTIKIGPEKIPAIAQAIYSARNLLTHVARPMPPTARYGGGSSVELRTHAALLEAAEDGWSGRHVPPVAWFLRAVALAHRDFLCKRLGLKRCPAGECDPSDDGVAETP